MAEQEMVKRLDAVTKGLTTIFVTHRSAMLQLADKVLVVDQGRIAAFGPREHVLKAEPVRV